MDDDLVAIEAAAELLTAHPDYRVLRRLGEDPRSAPAGDVFRRALYVDVETTGFDAGSDRIIELAMVLFGYDRDGRVTGVEERFDQLEDPGRPIPAEITALTGIRDEDVEGRRIDEGRVQDLVTRADLVIAHNAGFDRAFLERRLSIFAKQPWACSATDVPWRAAGMESRKLEFLAYRMGVFYDGHRAENDCLAGVHVLAQDLPGSEGTAMQALLHAARRTDVLFRAVGSPYETKDLLKARGYRWRPDVKVWWREVPEPEVEAERTWLAQEIYRGRNRAEEARVTAFERYSPRGR